MKAAPSRRARRKMHLLPVALGLLALLIAILLTDPFGNGIEKGYLKDLKLTADDEVAIERTQK